MIAGLNNKKGNLDLDDPPFMHLVIRFLEKMSPWHLTKNLFKWVIMKRISLLHPKQNGEVAKYLL